MTVIAQDLFNRLTKIEPLQTNKKVNNNKAKLFVKQKQL